eukprot:3548356-Alexandrium_andersonii.AAC.1
MARRRATGAQPERSAAPPWRDAARRGRPTTKRPPGAIVAQRRRGQTRRNFSGRGPPLEGAG